MIMIAILDMFLVMIYIVILYKSEHIINNDMW